MRGRRAGGGGGGAGKAAGGGRGGRERLEAFIYRFCVSFGGSLFCHNTRTVCFLLRVVACLCVCSVFVCVCLSVCACGRAGVRVCVCVLLGGWLFAPFFPVIGCWWLFFVVVVVVSLLLFLSFYVCFVPAYIA